MSGKFEVDKDAASNGELVASGEAYETKANVLRGVEAVQRAADGAVDDKTGE